MPKNSKKRSLPKLPKFGKFFRLKKSLKKKKVEEEATENQNGGPSTPTCLPEYSKLQAEIHEEEDQNDFKEIKQSLEDVSTELKGRAVVIEEKSEKISDEKLNGDTRGEAAKHENNHNDKTAGQHFTAEVVVHSHQDSFNSHSGKHSPSQQEDEKDNFSKITSHDESIVNSTEHDSASTTKQTESPKLDEYPEELIYPVVIKTPYVNQQSETDSKVNESVEEKSELCNGNIQHVQCKVVVHTPVKKQLISDTESNHSMIKSTVKNDDINSDDDSVLMQMPQTPPPKRPEKRDSQRILTVKKIRSIIATPYKKLKRDSSSLMDGQTYRYIEIQSLVNAFQTLHSCKGAMIASNEKGLHYGKSSVLRIECEDCHVKVFLQATKS